MPGKSRRRHPDRGRKRKGGRGSLAATAQGQAVAQAYQPVSQPEVSASSVSVPTPRVTPTVARYPYAVSELQRIGILAGIMLAILIVLALVLS